MNIFDELRPYFLMALGFFFGIGGHIILDRNRRKLDVTQTYRAILVELDELRYRMALGAHSIAMNHGKATRERVAELYMVARDFEKRHAREGISSKLYGMLSWPVQSIEAMSQWTQKQRESAGTGTSLKKAAVPLLGARLDQLTALPPNSQNALLEVKANIDILNEEIDMQRFFFQQTFSSSADETNHGIATRSSAQCEVNVSDRMRILVGKISALPELAIPRTEIPPASGPQPTAEERASAKLD
jgi:hypothetical protein